jgi:hypothetical protein
MIYNKNAVLHFEPTAATAGLKHFFTCPGEFMVKKIWVHITTAGAQANHKVELTNVANDETYVELTTGTTVANTTLEASVDEDKRYFSAGQVVALRNVTNDASAVYKVYVLIAHQE